MWKRDAALSYIEGYPTSTFIIIVVEGPRTLMNLISSLIDWRFVKYVHLLIKTGNGIDL